MQASVHDDDNQGVTYLVTVISFVSHAPVLQTDSVPAMEDRVKEVATELYKENY